MHPVVTEAVGIGGIVPVMPEGAELPVVLVEPAAPGTQPQCSGAIFKENRHTLSTKRACVHMIGQTVFEHHPFPVKFTSASETAEPQGSVMGFKDCINGINAQACGVGGILVVMGEVPGIHVKSFKTDIDHGDPEHTGSILADCADLTCRDRIAVPGVVSICFQVIAVIPVESVVAPKPDESSGVLNYAVLSGNVKSDVVRYIPKEHVLLLSVKLLAKGEDEHGAQLFEEALFCKEYYAVQYHSKTYFHSQPD
jgi:hypothetical protein